MNYKIFGIIILFLSFSAAAQTDSINQRIFLIGDAGEMPGTTHPVIAWLKKNADWNDEKNTVIYLGDNIYPLGMPLKGDPSYSEAKRVLDDQISLVRGKKARAIFIPGNHDWKNGKLGGWQQVMNQVDYINSLELKNVQSWPLYGCPGPVQVELSDKVVVALFDSEWFLYLHDKPGPGSNCDAKTIDEFQTELQEIANTHPNQVFIVAMHHPLYSYGIHGGDYPLKEHIFPFTAFKPNLYIPLPVIGSIYPLTRGVFGSIQDISHPLYRNMIGTVLEVIKKHPNSIVVSGHDHGLQLIERDSIPYIISGAGSVLSRTKPGRYSRFSDVEYGFSMIEVWKSGKVDVKFYNINSADLNTPTFSSPLKTLLPPPLQVLDTTRIILDSVVTVAAYPRLKGTTISRFFVGNNYRKEWTSPVRVPVLDMGKELGGLTPIKQGGGPNTKSLLMQDTTKKQWTLRSVIKYPSGSIPSDLRLSLLNTDLAEGISASYPYGSLSMGVFCNAAGIPYLREKLVYLPDDPRLTRFRAQFKNMLAIMEEKAPVGVKKSDNTDELVIKMAKNNDDHVDQMAVLKARLLDNFVMDFDRHEDQWQWGTIDTGRGKIFYPIPQDRDQVFFVNEGLIPKFARKPWLVPELQGFRPKAKNIKTFNRSARQFDRTFMTELSKDDWSGQIDNFLGEMTDSVIESALHQQPLEIHDQNMEKIIRTLKERRKYFKKEMMDYYRFISKSVSVVGTNQREQFTVTKNKDGSVRILVNKIRRRDSTLSTAIYDRTFDPDVTKQLRLFGLGDDDRFIIEGGNSPIKILIIGGSGNDEFINNGNGGKIAAYDVNFEKNTITGNKGIKNRISSDPEMNVYDRLNYKYNYFNPTVALAYNVDDGLFIGPKLEYIKQGFRKEPYATRQYFVAERAFKTGSYHFVYDGDFTRVLGNNDIAIRSDLRAPDNQTNFFGIGNNTSKTGSQTDTARYYRARYNIMNATLYVRQQLQSYLQVGIGPTFQSFTIDSLDNVGKYISSYSNNSYYPGLYNNKQYAGFDLRAAINSKNNNINPTRGLVLDAGIRSLFGLHGGAHNVTQVNVDMRIYMSLATKKKTVLATRFGWAKNYGAFEIPQAMYLSGTDNLRGFLKQRFAGRSVLFNNTELRIKTFDFNMYLFPGSAGFQLFNDVGRVFADNDPSQRWHDGYGIGIWIAPIQRLVITASLAHSVEETALPRLTFGFEF